MWESLINENCRCSLCSAHSLLETGAFPILQKTKPRNTDLLFIMESPCHDDTFNPLKGYLTIDPENDPTIKFFLEYYTEVLGMNMQDLFMTNSVLCLPKQFASQHPITTLQRNLCVGKLRQMIDTFNPSCVCTIGYQALKALDIIEKHGYNSMNAAVGIKTDWYGRILFPLYHTAGLARISRSREEQVEDWQKLGEVMAALKFPLHQ